MILSLLIHVTNEKKKSENQGVIRMLRVFTVWVHMYLFLAKYNIVICKQILTHFNQQICTFVCSDSTKYCQEKNDTIILMFVYI